MSDLTAQPVSKAAYGLGEGPVWDGPRERLLWVDIVAGRVHSGTLRGNTLHEQWAEKIDETVSAVAVSESGDLLVAGRRDLYWVNTHGDRQRLVGVVPGGKRSRLNDGACDPAGRFLVGSLAQDGRTGDECLYRWDDDRITTLDDDLTLSNGLAWSADGTVLFSVDTIPGIVSMREYDVSSGRCGAREELLRIEDGKPDGLCLDVDGNLWIAIWGSGQIRCYRPDGVVIGTVGVAAPNTSSLAFVGTHLDRLLITTARTELTEDQLEEFPDSGRLFMADVGVAGLPVHAWTPHSSSIERTL